MEHATQVALARELLGYIDNGTTCVTDNLMHNSISTYTSPEQFAREKEILFRQHPLMLGFSAQLRKPGDYIINHDTEVPVLMVRNRQGQVNAFINVCRHRGAMLTQEPCGHARKTFTCPYHAWSYDLDGKLVGIPDRYGFDDLNTDDYGLVRLPVAERHGMIWVQTTPGTAFDIDSYLGDASKDLAAYGVEGYHLYGQRVLTPAMNWKLVSDTFWEIYHIPALHKRTIGPLFQPNLAALETFGPHHRVFACKKSIVELRQKPEDEWNVIPHGTILYSLFPNTVFIMQGDHIEIFQIFPKDGKIDESIMYITVLVPEAPGDEPAVKHWDANIKLLLDTLDEDFTTGAGIQKGFASGAQERVVYGRYEAGLDHFHSSIRRALGMAA